MKEDDRTRLQFQYAWSWFDYHAKQRTTIFNFFLVITGILANGYVLLVDKQLYALAVVLAGIGFVAAVGFLCLDQRNRDMVHWGEDVLEGLERRNFFGPTAGEEQLGLLLREKNEEASYKSAQPMRAHVVRHTFVIQLIESLVGAAFLGGVVFALASMRDVVLAAGVASIIGLLVIGAGAVNLSIVSAPMRLQLRFFALVVALCAAVTALSFGLQQWLGPPPDRARVERPAERLGRAVDDRLRGLSAEIQKLEEQVQRAR